MSVSATNTRIRFGIMHRFLLALLVPTLGLMIAAGDIVVEKRLTVREMDELSSLVGVVTRMSALVHELQKERGASALFLGSRGSQFQRELPEQRQATDRAQRAFAETLAGFNAAARGGDLAVILKDTKARLDELDARRQDISALKLAGPASAAYYTGAIGRLLDIGFEATKAVTNVEAAARLTAYVDLMQAKERAGLERAMGAGALAGGKFELAAYRRFVEVQAEQESYFRLFRAYATPAEAGFLNQTLVGDAVREVERIRKLLVETPPGSALTGVEASYWFRVSTDRIDLLKKIEDYLAGSVTATAEAIRASANGAFMLATSAAAVLLAVTLVLGFFMVRGVTRPVGAMTSAMRQLAGGDTTVEIPARQRRDEVGQMAAAVEIFKQSMIDANRLRAEQEEMKTRAEAEKRAQMTKMADEFEASVKGIVQGVSSAATQLQSTAQSMTATAEESSRQATAVAAACEQASTNVQTVASAAEELSSSIAEIGRQVAESSRVTGQAVDDAARTNTQVQGLAEAAQRIGDVVKLINDIAGQTNLLALNATIEAARAGEAGKGFAVVASEVKSLANQTARATEEISSKIAEMQAATGQSVAAIQQIGGTIQRINEIATTIASAVEEQGAATQEIARNVQQASAGTSEVSSNITGVTEAASQTGAAASQVLGASGALAKQSEQLRGEVEAFIARVRAG